MRIGILGGALAGVGIVGTAHAGAAPVVQSEGPASEVGAKIPCYDIRASDVGFYRSVTITP